MGLFDFFKKKKPDSVEAEERMPEPQETQVDTDVEVIQEEAEESPDVQAEEAQSMEETAQVEQTEENVQSEQTEETNSAESASDNAPASDVHEAQSGPASASGVQEAQHGPAPGQHRPPLTPEEMAKKRAEQEELTKKRDGEGMVLSYLIQRHHDMRNGDSFKSVLESLTTCWLWVPMRMQVSKADALAMEAARKEGRKYAPKDQVRLAPSLIRTKDGQLVFSTYTNRDEIPKDMQKQFIWVQMPSGQCGRNVLINPSINAMVINPTGKSLLLKRELLEKLMKPVRTPEQQAEQDLASQPDTTGYTS